MTTPQPKNHLIPIRVTEAQHAYLQQLAGELDVPVSTALRQVLEDAIRGRALVDQVESMLQQDGLVSEETADAPRATHTTRTCRGKGSGLRRLGKAASIGMTVRIDAW